MNFTDFQTALLDEIKVISGEELEVFPKKLNKNNGVIKDAMCIRKKGEAMAPLIYLEDYYSQYKNGVPLITLARHMIKLYQEDIPKKAPTSLKSFNDFETVRNKIFCRLVNYEMNSTLLARIPYRRTLDLAITYYYHVDDLVCKDATIVITNEHLIKWKIGEDTLYHIAWENTIRELPCDVERIEDTLRDLMTPEELEEISLSDHSDSDFIPMHIITNSSRCMGAISILYPLSLKKTADHLNSNLYILPSSIHECILIPQHKSYSKQDLEQIVTDINTTQVAPQEVLSNRVYFYNRGKDTISL